MRQKGFRLVSFLVMIFIPAVALLEAADQYKVVGGPTYFYMGHISYSELSNDSKDPVVYREGQKVAETAVVNLPLGPGDTVQTSDGGRCEIQFDNGTMVRLDKNTRFKIETILAEGLSTRNLITNLVLNRGQIYVLFKQYDHREIFQVLTPVSAVKLSHNAVAMIKAAEEGDTDVQLETGKAKIMFGPAEKKLDEKKIKPKERWIVSKDHRAQASKYEMTEDFLAWNNQVNQNFEQLHEGSNLPKPIERYPLAIRYFAQKFANPFGEWLWHDLFGYTWRPYYNDMYPNGTWAPYVYGRWTSLNDQLYWVPEEPWGWVPYHLGLWTWDAKKGWLWIPGSIFSSAWVRWGTIDNFLCWSPWMLWDWFGPGPGWLYWGYAFNYYGWQYPYYSAQYRGSYNDFSFYYENNGRSDGQGTNTKPFPLTKISKDQLKMRKNPALPLPAEMKKTSQALVKALLKGDENVVASFHASSRAVRIVNKEDLKAGRISDRIIPRERFAELMIARAMLAPSLPKGETAADTQAQAVRIFQRNAGFRQGEKRAVTPPIVNIVRRSGNGKEFSNVVAVPLKSVIREGMKSPIRFRDFNPDVRIAVRQGVHLSYDSGRNSVFAPGIRTSGGVGPVGLNGSGARSGGWASGSSGGSSGGSGGSSHGSSSSSSSRSSSNASSGSHEGGRSGVRN